MKNTIDIREKILELITKTMNEYDYREPSEEYASHEMLLLISRIKELPAAEEVERWAIVSEGLEFAIFDSKEDSRVCAAGLSGEVHRVAIRRLEDK
jgi:hypothetical protein